MKDNLFAVPPSVKSLDDCHFYHTTDIPGVGTVDGAWDLRDGVHDYLGGIDFSGKRVLEIGPASGFLTFYMESQGAEVVCVDLPVEKNYVWDIVPHADLDLEHISHNRAKALLRLRNAFWFCHERFNSRAQVYYGSAYNLPKELGHFDIAVCAAVLVHSQNPIKILDSCAALTRQTIIVTEKHDSKLPNQGVCKLIPRPNSKTWDTWWNFTPEFFTQYLGVIGYSQSKVDLHEQNRSGKNKMVELFTVVANRPREIDA